MMSALASHADDPELTPLSVVNGWALFKCTVHLACPASFHYYFSLLTSRCDLIGNSASLYSW
jgi:hypothetical protein